MNRKRTLILATVGIVTVAIGAGMTWYLSRLRKAVATTKNTLESLDKGLAQYKFVKSAYPTKEEGLAAAVRAWAVLQCAQTSAPQTCIDQPRQVPKDGWGHDFRYTTDGPQHALVTSAGPDGEFDTSDDMHLVSKDRGAVSRK